jgi:signal transduction histidine kinase
MTAPRPSPAPVILVVDDNEANRALAASTLEDEDYVVILAPGGAEGIAAFEEHRPDCVLLDVRMPNVDGFAVCERIRASPGGRDVPIVFLTAQRDVDTFDRAQRAGADDFLTKPFRPNELVMRVEAALKLRQLRSEVSEHYALLKKQRDDLVRVQLQKERLTAFLVHDLKNPVYAMDLHAQVLLRERDLPPAAREAGARIRAEAKQLTRMIMNLLDISKGDEGKLVAQRAPLDVAALVRDVCAELGAAATAAAVRLESTLDGTNLKADPDLVRRLLTNLVENAIRHCPRDTVVRVRSERAEGGILLKVIDEGRGVPEEMTGRIFDPFVQVEGSPENLTRTGRGLGLAFCRVAAEAHGGRIWVEDRTAENAATPNDVSTTKVPGACFCVYLKDA